MLVSIIALIILLFIYEWLNRFERLYYFVYILIHIRNLIQLYIVPGFSDFKEFIVFLKILLEAITIYILDNPLIIAEEIKFEVENRL